MSRSFRRPYSSCTGSCTSAKEDKQRANRSIRHRIHTWIAKELKKEEGFDLIPHRFECASNDVYGWNRDGHQIYQGLSARDWSKYLRAVTGEGYGISMWPAGNRWYQKHCKLWPPLWYQRLLRK